MKYETGTCILILHGISQVIKVEKLAKEKSIEVDLIPTPREISSDCGMAVLFYQKDQERIRHLLAEASLDAGEFFCK
jgi:hypothetical protein